MLFGRGNAHLAHSYDPRPISPRATATIKVPRPYHRKPSQSPSSSKKKFHIGCYFFVFLRLILIERDENCPTQSVRSPSPENDEKYI